MNRNRRESMHEWLNRLDERAERIEVAPHYVYRAYDENDVLLYVGCTVDVKSRMSGHASKPWRPFMRRLEVSDPYAGKEQGRAAEKLAIDTEGPLFNSTQADVNRTNANIHAAKRELAWVDIFPPRFEIAEDEIHTFSSTPEWDAYCDDDQAYRDLVEEVRAELKQGDFPYLTDDERLTAYLELRAASAAA